MNIPFATRNGATHVASDAECSRSHEAGTDLVPNMGQQTLPET